MSMTSFSQLFTPVLWIARGAILCDKPTPVHVIFPGGKNLLEKVIHLVLEIQGVSAFSMRGCQNLKGIDLAAGYSKERLIR